MGEVGEKWEDKWEISGRSGASLVPRPPPFPNAGAGTSSAEEEEVYGRAHIWVHGRVQGVSFRDTAVTAAKSLGLTGWVRNLRDGRVESVAEGPRASVERFLTWCHQGPSGSRWKRAAIVEGLYVEWEETKPWEFSTFTKTFLNPWE